MTTIQQYSVWRLLRTRRKWNWVIENGQNSSLLRCFAFRRSFGENYSINTTRRYLLIRQWNYWMIEMFEWEEGKEEGKGKEGRKEGIRSKRHCTHNISFVRSPRYFGNRRIPHQETRSISIDWDQIREWNAYEKMRAVVSCCFHFSFLVSKLCLLHRRLVLYYYYADINMLRPAQKLDDAFAY